MASDMTDEARQRAGWTRNQPTAKGFYWYRPVHYAAPPQILEIGSGMSLPRIVLNTDRFYLSQWDGEWLGPITPDDGDREYRRGLEACEAWLKEFIEWNACSEDKPGHYKCHQCEREQIPGKQCHDEDCDIVTAKALLDRLAQEARRT